jgi:hypothetical protein
MAKFLLLYRGAATPMDRLGEAEAAEVLRKWEAWSRQHADSVLDINPFGASTSVGSDGAEQTSVTLQGHTVVEAESLEDAKRFCEGHPFYDGAEAGSVIDIFEALPMPY